MRKKCQWLSCMYRNFAVGWERMMIINDPAHSHHDHGSIEQGSWAASIRQSLPERQAQDPLMKLQWTSALLAIKQGG